MTPTRGSAPRAAWKSRVWRRCSSGELLWLHGFLLSLGTPAELHLRQLDVPDHVGVCEDRNTLQGTHGGGNYTESGRSTQNQVKAVSADHGA